MYSNKLAVAIKTAGKVLREQGDKVFLPFGSEYSIFIKNLNSVRALVRVSLDGQSVTDGEDLVIYGNNELNLERFLRKNNMESGNRFKFIERDAKVEAHRGIGGEDGILRVEFQFEKVVPKPIVVETVHKHYHDHYNKPYYPPYNPWKYDPYWYGNTTFGCSGALGSSDTLLRSSAVADNVSCSVSNGGTGAATLNASNAISAGTQSITSTSFGSAPSGSTRKLLKSALKKSVAEAAVKSYVDDNQDGITVAGSVSDQKFQTASWFEVETEKYVICLKLLGETSTGKVVETPVLVRQKQTCSSCGTRNRGQNQFCRHCGTALELVGESPKRRVAAKGVRG